MKNIKVAGAALNQIPLDWEGNLARLREAFRQARIQNVSILCLPELSITGYGCEDAFCSSFVREKAWSCLQSLLPESKSLFACVGLPVAHQGAIYNCIAVICDQKLLGFLAKKKLAGDGVHYEPRWFKVWPENVCQFIEKNGETVPIGDFHVDLQGIKIGFEICEEAWVADRPGIRLAQLGADVILNPSASHFAFGKNKVREGFIREGSRAFCVAYIYANLLGNESGRIIFDGDVLIATEGRIVASGQRLSFLAVVLTTSVLDVDMNRLCRNRSASFQPISSDRATCIQVPFCWPEIAPPVKSSTTDSWEESPYLKEEEFTRAVALGLFDYLRKSKSQGFVVSMSGGVDSAAVATLVALSFHFSIQELGMEGVKKKLTHIPAIQFASTAEDLIQSCLTCLYQATQNSSEATRLAAKNVTLSLRAAYYEWDVEPLVFQYQELVSNLLKRELNWNEDDVPLQNIQARTRAPGVWLLANVKNALLLATSNRSEIAVGYATMDGDTCGGLSPIAGVDKAFLLHWMEWLQESGPIGFFPVADLEWVLRLPPTAELRPHQDRQADEKDLMPYAVLDVIERMAIRDKRSPQETLSLVSSAFGQYSRMDLKNWVRLFFKLWAQNQWKRERYAPSFHLDDEGLDPKTWCRFPILSSAFEEELQELKSGEPEIKGEQASYKPES